MPEAATNEQAQDPIFIVGAPRSGTTLLAALLSGHSRMSCGPETHFFRALYRIPVEKLVAADEWPAAAVEFLYSIQDEGLPVPDNFALARAAITAYLNTRQPSVTAILEALTVLDMRREHKCRWIEKTPNHLRHVGLIRRFYPRAPIVRIIRDPRDVALSILKAPWDWAPRNWIGALELWRSYDGMSHDFFETDDRSLTIHYERILCEGEVELRKLCHFLCEDFEPQMLDTSHALRTVDRLHEPWKRKVAQPLDPRRAAVWRREISAAQAREALALLGDRLQHYGYAAEEPPPRYLWVYPQRLIAEYPEAVSWAAAHGYRLWPSGPRETENALLYLGDPSLPVWFPNSRSGRIRRAATLLGRLAASIVVRKPRYWWRGSDRRSTTGVIATVLAGAVERCAVRIGSKA